MNTQKPYRIFKKAIPADLLNRITEYRHLPTTQEEFDTTTYDDSEIFGKSADGVQNTLWRKHQLYKLSNELADDFSRHFFQNVTLDDVYDHVFPTLTTYVYLNVFRHGDFLKEHVDPPTAIWDQQGLIRRANFSCVINNHYVGGELTVNGIQVEPMDPGDVVVFPQPLPHGVNPVIHGERFVVFGWIYDEGISNDVGLETTNKRALELLCGQ
jgi:predicted 2-oxoglutarate/Fe(II)-dependent dioxygenase YbiX